MKKDSLDLSNTLRLAGNSRSEQLYAEMKSNIKDQNFFNFRKSSNQVNVRDKKKSCLVPHNSKVNRYLSNSKIPHSDKSVTRSETAFQDIGNKPNKEFKQKQQQIVNKNNTQNKKPQSYGKVYSSYSFGGMKDKSMINSYNKFSRGNSNGSYDNRSNHAYSDKNRENRKMSTTMLQKSKNTLGARSSKASNISNNASTDSYYSRSHLNRSTLNQNSCIGIGTGAKKNDFGDYQRITNTKKISNKKEIMITKQPKENQPKQKQNIFTGYSRQNEKSKEKVKSQPAKKTRNLNQTLGQKQTQKTMKYIEQKDIPTDKWLKNDRNETYMESADRKSVNHFTPTTNLDINMDQIRQKIDNGKSHDFEIQPSLKILDQFIEVSMTKLNLIQTSQPKKENQIDSFECEEQIPGIIFDPNGGDDFHSSPGHLHILEINQQDSQLIAEEVDDESDKRKEVYKSEINLIGLMENKQHYNKIDSLGTKSSGERSVSDEYQSNVLEPIDDLQVGETQIADEGKAHDAAYFSSDQNNISRINSSCHSSRVFNNITNTSYYDTNMLSKKDEIVEIHSNQMSDTEKTQQNDDGGFKVEKHKSPKAATKPTPAIEWQSLIDEALQDENSSNDDIISKQSEPENKVQQFDQQTQLPNDQQPHVKHQIEHQIEIEKDQHNNISLSNGPQSACIIKSKNKLNQISVSEGMTDHGEGSPIKSDDMASQGMGALLNKIDNLDAKQNVQKLVYQKHYYDPHEPHSALNNPKKMSETIIKVSQVDSEQDSQNFHEQQIQNSKNKNSRNENNSAHYNKSVQLNTLQKQDILLGKGFQLQNLESNLEDVASNFVIKAEKSPTIQLLSQKSTADRKNESFQINNDTQQQNKVQSPPSQEMQESQSPQAQADESIQQYECMDKLEVDSNQECAEDMDLKLNCNEDINQVGNDFIMSDQELHVSSLDLDDVNESQNNMPQDPLDLHFESNQNQYKQTNNSCFDDTQYQNEEEALVDDGFFDNLMEQSSQNKKQSFNIESGMNFNNSYAEEEDAFKIQQSKVSCRVDNNNPYQDQVMQQNFVQRVNLSKEIYANVQKSYDPSTAVSIQNFQGMVQKEMRNMQRESQFNQSINNQTLFQMQPQLTSEMRLMLLDWMCQVSADYCLKRPTFHLSNQLVDYFLLRCGRQVKTSQFQLIGVTCLHMASKIEEIYPPHIKAFAEAADESVTTQQIVETEFEIGAVMGWNFSQFMTYYDWSSWYMKRWDKYVDSSLSYLKFMFQLKFYDNTRQGHKKFVSFMNFIDIVSMDYESKKYSQRILVACLMYLFLGGKDIMCAFQFEYKQMFQAFQNNFPIPNRDHVPTQHNRLPEGILFYNQIIEPFFVNEFCCYLHDLIEPMKHVLKFLILEIDKSVQTYPQQLVKQCQLVIKQYDDIVLEKYHQIISDGHQPNNIIMDQNRDIKEDDVFSKYSSEFLAFQTFNDEMLETLKMIEKYNVSTRISQVATPVKQYLSDSSSQQVSQNQANNSYGQYDQNYDLQTQEEMSLNQSEFDKANASALSSQNVFTVFQEDQNQQSQQSSEVFQLKPHAQFVPINNNKREYVETSQKQSDPRLVSLNMQRESYPPNSLSQTHSIYNDSDERRAIKNFQNQDVIFENVIECSEEPFIHIDDGADQNEQESYDNLPEVEFFSGNKDMSCYEDNYNQLLTSNCNSKEQN